MKQPECPVSILEAEGGQCQQGPGPLGALGWCRPTWYLVACGRTPPVRLHSISPALRTPVNVISGPLVLEDGLIFNHIVIGPFPSRVLLRAPGVKAWMSLSQFSSRGS